MRGVFCFNIPEATDLTLAVTASLLEWRQIAKALEEVVGPDGKAPDVLRRQILDLIRTAEKTLAQSSWTTGYATGPEKDD